ncbi:hypothetical protein A3Q29_22330 [Providencia stuartii]|uniref:Uncharacterized protein n=1 Tax=Providencia stuartii TaxID=588 RepID=A0A1S1HRZ4_PROST|nr:hypothetical protein A3Q29_22330 [Providencia stuartii]
MITRLKPKLMRVVWGLVLNIGLKLKPSASVGTKIEIMLNDTEYPEGNFEGETVHSFSGVDSVTIG